MKKIFLIPLLLLSGCTFKSSNNIPINKSETIGIKKEDIYTKLEEELIRSAKKQEAKYNEYIELLTSLQKRYRPFNDTKIARGLGKKITFTYDGPALALLKQIAEEGGYKVDFKSARIMDSKIISREWTDTRLQDIIYEIASDLRYDIQIDERNMIITLKDL